MSSSSSVQGWNGHVSKGVLKVRGYFFSKSSPGSMVWGAGMVQFWGYTLMCIVTCNNKTTYSISKGNEMVNSDSWLSLGDTN